MNEAVLVDGRLVAPHSAAPPMDKAVRRWLLLLWAMVFAMVVLGGITRLTGSGLSIVEWQPLMGALPPFHEADWQELFAKYQRTVQYRQVNHWMALADFKRIFFWEYVHRLFGRLIGVTVLLPWIYFLWRKLLDRTLALKTLGIFGLGGIQGFVGWYMVQSGLWEEPRVSHLRLATHLLLAFVTGQCLLWLALDGYFPGRSRPAASGGQRAAAIGLLGVLLIQVAYGAFMAGTHAGYYYATFPDMNGHLLPGPFFATGSAWEAAITSPPAIHYLHRAVGALVLLLALGLWGWLRATRVALGGAAGLCAILTLAQVNLGALTVVSRVAIPWAVAHQALAYLLVSAALLLWHRAHGSHAVR